jgi:hypothetical protein
MWHFFGIDLGSDMNKDTPSTRVALACITITLALIAGVAFYLLGSQTGPGCPGNPEWLGYCADIPQDVK